MIPFLQPAFCALISILKPSLDIGFIILFLDLFGCALEFVCGALPPRKLGWLFGLLEFCLIAMHGEVTRHRILFLLRVQSMFPLFAVFFSYALFNLLKEFLFKFALFNGNLWPLLLILNRCRTEFFFWRVPCLRIGQGWALDKVRRKWDLTPFNLTLELNASPNWPTAEIWPVLPSHGSTSPPPSCT